MQKEKGVHGWLKAAITAAFAALVLGPASMSGARVVRAQGEQTQAPRAGFRWQYQLDFIASSAASAGQQESSLKPTFDNLGVSSELQALGGSNYRLVMTGNQDIERLRQALFEPQIASFIGGAGEIEVDIPVRTLESLTITLESNLTTGYSWQFLTGKSVGVLQAGDPSFAMRSNADGVPFAQTLVFQPQQLGEAKAILAYQRPFETDEVASRHLLIVLASQPSEIDLSDPNLKVVSSRAASSPSTSAPNPIQEIPLSQSLPSSWDWSSFGIVPAIRDQGACGSCWAFGTVGIMESAIKKAGGPLTDLSEQFLVSCNKDGWSCNGGLTAHKYHYNTLGLNQNAVGAVLEADDPYTATNGTCTVAYNHPYKLNGWQFIVPTEWDMPTVDQIKNAIYDYGPVTAAMCAGPAFQGYGGGIFTTDETAYCGGGTDHQIILVGWNDAGGYWILRNSWGTSWGENGYMRIAYNTSRVGQGTSWVIWGGGIVSGTVKEAGTGTPIVGATIAVLGSGQTTSGAGGAYTLNLPVGTYNITASAYGYLPNTANNVTVTANTTTTKNFSLAVAPTDTVSGQVTDAATGWPLYASIDISGYPGGTIWTNPVTGVYSVILPEGSTFTFDVKAWVGGYTSAERSVGPLAGNQTQNFALSADPVTCTAPGYELFGFAENFDSATPPALPADWAVANVSGTGASWATHAGTVHPNGIAAHSSPNLVYFNSWTASNGSQARLYRTAGINMTALASSTLTFWMYHDTQYINTDSVQAQVSTNGGSSWSNVGAAINRYNGIKGWQQHSVDLSAYASQTDLRLGFLGTSAYGNDEHLDDILVGPGCTQQAGGLVVGNVYNASTNTAVAGATVSNDGGYSTITAATVDPAVDDAFYTLFSPAGTHTFTATKSGGYGPDVASVGVAAGSTVLHNFHLPSVSLSFSPNILQATLPLGANATVPFTITNNGAVTATFTLKEMNGGYFNLASNAGGHGTWLYRASAGVLMKSNKGGEALAYPAAYRWVPNKASPERVLIYADDWVHAPPETYLDQALQALGVAYTAHYDGDYSGFETDLAKGGWDEVLYEGDNYMPPSTTLAALNSWVQGGGHLAAEAWNQGYASANPLFATMGVTYVSDYGSPSPSPAIYWWNPTHAIFTSPASAPQWPSYTCPAGVCGQYEDPVPGAAVALAGYTPTVTSGQGALILRNDGRTLFKAFLDVMNTDTDADSDGIKDAVELWMNIASYNLYSDIPWLSETPTSGSIDPGKNQVIDVTFDASAVSQNGVYGGMLKILSNDPYTPHSDETVMMATRYFLYLPLVIR